MINRTKVCRQKADDCERAAARVTDPDIQAGYRQWRELPNRQQEIDEALAGIGTV